MVMPSWGISWSVEVTRDSSGNATWDSSDCGYDLESTEISLGHEGRIIDCMVNSQFGIPTDIQLYWYEWMLYELEDCIDDSYFKYPQDIFGRWGPPPRGSQGPLKLLESVKKKAQDRTLPDCAIFGSYEDFVEASADALEFRHLAEHRDKSMEIRFLHAAVYLPRRLKDDIRAEKFEHV